jgi:hypothetical protein
VSKTRVNALMGVSKTRVNALMGVSKTSVNALMGVSKTCVNALMSAMPRPGHEIVSAYGESIQLQAIMLTSPASKPRFPCW